MRPDAVSAIPSRCRALAFRGARSSTAVSDSIAASNSPRSTWAAAHLYVGSRHAPACRAVTSLADAATTLSATIRRAHAVIGRYCCRRGLKMQRLPLLLVLLTVAAAWPAAALFQE